MPISQNFHSYAEIVKYRLPIYVKTGKDKYVYFYVLDPQSVLEGTPKLKRLKKKFNNYPNGRARDEAASRFCADISAKLREGWNPLMDDKTTKGFTDMTVVIKKYRSFLGKCLKDGVLKPKTHTDYLSRLIQLENWNAYTGCHTLYAQQVDSAYVSSFLEYIYIERDTTPTTRNNYLTWFSTFCSYMVSQGYLSRNPCEDIKPLREQDKKRQALNQNELKALHDHLSTKDPWFLMACQFHYYTLIRPSEMVQLRINNIRIKEQTIMVSHSISKNRRDGVVTIPAKLITTLIDLGVFNNDGQMYIFGKDFKPSYKQCSSRIFRDKWATVREELHWPREYQFYSLKDTGISDTIDRAGLTVARDQARHQDVSTTNRYVRNGQMTSHAELKEAKGNL